jgi:two-component system chemotaxis response regulator CheB
LRKLSTGGNFKGPTSLIRTTNKIIAVGASTGGTEAILEVLRPLPRTIPPIIIVQHMPGSFTNSFANRLNSLCKIEVKEAQHMEVLSPGKALIVPGNQHAEIMRSGAVYYVKLLDGPLVNHHRPSVDVLFHSVAKVAGKNAYGVMLTGMGKDGAAGMLAMKKAGAYNIAQNEQTSIVYGMPKEAVEAGAVDVIKPLGTIAKTLLEQFSAKGGGG